LIAPFKKGILTYFIVRRPVPRARARRFRSPRQRDKTMRVASFLDHQIDWCEYHALSLGRRMPAVTLE
jgi:hypothetical protein